MDYWSTNVVIQCFLENHRLRYIGTVESKIACFSPNADQVLVVTNQPKVKYSGLIYTVISFRGTRAISG